MIAGDDETKRVVSTLGPEQLALLEDLRFRKEEEANSRDLARALIQLGDVYVVGQMPPAICKLTIAPSNPSSLLTRTSGDQNHSRPGDRK